MFAALTLIDRNGVGNGTEALVVGVLTGSGIDATTSRALAAHGLEGAATALIAEAAKRADFADAGSIVEVFVPRGARGRARGGESLRVLLVNLGAKEKAETDGLRNLGGSIGRRLAAAKATAAVVEMGGAVKAAGLDPFRAGCALGEGLGLIAWVCDEFRGSVFADAKTAAKRTKLTVTAADREIHEGMERGLGLAQSANFARTLSQTPPNIATPAYMAQAAAKLAKRVGLGLRVFEGKALEQERFEGLINVGKASENKPCMIRLEYQPPGARGGKGRSPKPLVLIGKTMTYDTGGLSLKVNNGMVGMKRDKDGGCAVLGAMHAIATVIKPRRPVVALLAAAENSISDEAYRPDDVLTYRNGVTVEVTNTDAEGRLVLADALCWACEKENPAAIIDLATLTGGVVVALGGTYCGMFCENDDLRAKIERAAKASGERVWRLPMHAEYRDMMKSPVADILNSNPNRKAHPIQGAAFLSYFVKDEVPWCHLDIAGVHVAERNAGAFIEGPTGWGARLLAELLDEQ